MKTLKLTLIALTIGLLASCSSDDDNNGTSVVIKADAYENLHAPNSSTNLGEISGDFVKFNFETGKIVTDDTWDVGFRSTQIIVNGGTAAEGEPERTGEGGVYIETALYNEVTQVATDASFSQDDNGIFAIATGSGNGWYNYDFSTHIISPIPGKIVVFKTHDGNYAKIEILSYYKDSPTNPDPFTDQSSTYTFNYTYSNTGSFE